MSCLYQAPFVGLRHENCTLSDIHGNEIALSEVLRDIEARGGATGYWILGDFGRSWTAAGAGA